MVEATSRVESVQLRQTLRPTKFCFVVKLKDPDMIERTAEINAALWGGMLNPIVPLEYGPDTILRIFRASHSDFLVDATGELRPESLGKGFQRKLIPLEDANGLVSKKSGKLAFRFGCDMRPLYAALDKLPDASTLGLLVSEVADWRRYALFQSGLFPDGFEHDYERLYLDSTVSDRIVLDESTVATLQFYRLWSPLPFTLLALRFSFRSMWTESDSHVIFIWNWQSYGDWLEFWNLRSFGSNILFVPHNRLDLFERNISQYLEARQYPLNAGDEKIENHTTVQKGSSLSGDEFRAATSAIASQHKGNWASRNWLPHFAIERRQEKDKHADKYAVHGLPQIEAPIATSRSQEDIAFVLGGSIEFRFLSPTWLENWSRSDMRSWSVSLDFRGAYDSGWCFRYPALPEVEEALLDSNLGIRQLRLSPRENIVYHGGRIVPLETTSFRPMTAQSLFGAVFEHFGLVITEVSEKGQYAARIEETMGGPYGGANLLRDKGVRHLLTRLASENSEMNLPRQELEKTIRESSPLVKRPTNPMRPDQIVNELVNKRVLRVGLELKCQYCYKRGWYHINELGEDFTCRYCFTKQPAELYDVPEWRYKSSGLFATKDVGYGSLVVISTALFFRFATHDLHMKHLYSFNVQDRDATPSEVDLAVLHRQHSGDYQVAVCECKTSDFKDSDFARLFKMVEKIPSAIACIATMKSQLSPPEKDQAKRFWDQGHPLIVLTETELESSDLPNDKRLGGLSFTTDFAELAEATRRLHLD